MKTLKEIGQEFVQHSGVNATLKQHVIRAQEEMDELRAEAWHDQTGAILDTFPPMLPTIDNARVINEMADVIITLATAAAQLGLDLDAGISAKHEANMERRWAPHPTILGAVKHIKEGK